MNKSELTNILDKAIYASGIVIVALLLIIAITDSKPKPQIAVTVSAEFDGYVYWKNNIGELCRVPVPKSDDDLHPAQCMKMKPL